MLKSSIAFVRLSRTQEFCVSGVAFLPSTMALPCSTHRDGLSPASVKIWESVRVLGSRFCEKTSRWIVLIALLMSFSIATTCASMRVSENLGIAIAAKIPKITITNTSSSILNAPRIYSLLGSIRRLRVKVSCHFVRLRESWLSEVLRTSSITQPFLIVRDAPPTKNRTKNSISS